MADPFELQKLATLYIVEKLEKIFGLKKNEGAEKFRQSFDTDEIKRDMAFLFNNPNKVLILALNKDNNIIPVYKDSRYQKKAVLIMKANREEDLNEDMYKNFLFIELSKSMLDQMYIICKDIFYPMLSQTVYQEETSDLISKDLMEKFHNFLANFYVCLGHIAGKTQLPVPSEDIFTNPKMGDNDRTQICEGGVIMWIELIKNILKQEPENDFRNGNNPRPLTEVSFWNKKSDSLKSIIRQIKGEQILDILKFLEKQKSSYFKLFNETKRDVLQKEKEATQNAKFLNFLKPELEKLEDMNSSIPDLVDLFIPIFHIIRLIWKDNEYYKKPERLIVLLRKICNIIIDQGSKEIHTSIFSKIHDPDLIDEAIEKLELVRLYIQKFMEAYFQYKDRDDMPWQISRNVVFFRLDAFNDRVGDILNIALSFKEFVNVHTKSIGGIKGEVLINTLQDIFKECSNAVKIFTRDDYNPLDISSNAFNTKYNAYKETLKELEKRIAAILTQTFDECDTIVGKFKILENFDTILERPNIVIELENKYKNLLDLYKNELRTVQNLFISGKEYIDKDDPRSPLNRNMPPVASMLIWLDSLKERIKEPYSRFITVGPRIINKEEFKEIEKLYNSIIRLLMEYEESKKKNWEDNARTYSTDKLKDYILAKKDSFIQINFDPNLLQLLKEIKYFKILNLPIPNEAEALYEKNPIFRKHIGNLENICIQYNNIIRSLNDVETPLIREKLNKVQKMLDPGFSQLTWEKTKEIDDFVAKSLNNISDLASTVEKLKLFVYKIEHILREWKEGKKLFTRPSTPQDAPSLLAAFLANFGKDKSDMLSKCKDLTSVSEVLNALKSAVSNLEIFKKLPEWANYRHYINSIVLNGFIEMIYGNLEHLYSCLDPNLDAFCSVKLMLNDRKLIFEPDLISDEETSIKGMVLRWVDNFLNLSTLAKNRVDTTQGDYMVEVLEDFRIQEIVYRLYNEINELIKDSDNIIGAFKEYETLWAMNFEDSFNDFIKSKTELPADTPEKQEEDDKIKNMFGKENPLDGIVLYTPSKEVFDEKINEYKNMLSSLKKLQKEKKVRWLIVDFSIFLNDLTGIINRWISDFKEFLKNNSTKKFNNIKIFVQRVKNGIANIPKSVDDPEDRKKFTGVLEVIYDSTVLFPTLERLIPKIVDELEILKKHSKLDTDEDEDEEKDAASEEQKMINQTLELKNNIDVLNKGIGEVKADISNLIEKEASNFKEEVKEFEHKIEKYRQNFNANLPKRIETFTQEEIDNAYKKIDIFYIELKGLEEKKKENNRMERLLGITISQNKQINDCLNDIKLYKILWDYVSICFNSINDWKKIKWDKVNPDEFAEKVDIYKNMIGRNVIKKELRLIEAFKTLNEKIKIMEDLAVIVKVLKDRAIKSRHWKSLMKKINKNIPYDSPDFSIETLMELEMFREKDTCDVEKSTANSQIKIEDDFNKIEKIWKTAEFKMEKNIKYEFPIFNYDKMDLIIEELEKNKMTLTTHYQNKAPLENFEDMDERLKKMLDTILIMKNVLTTWLKLQKSYEKYQPIFKADDIKKTLRNESEDFKNLDVKFKEEMKHASEILTIIEVCTGEKEVILTEMTTTIKNCGAALENYLTEKKNIFPRFYFLSNDTLLNMLSYTDYPNVINKNVKDCFDGIKQWKMTELNEEDKSNTVLAMLSAENDEEVVFAEPFVCQGLVERYLCEFEAKMRGELSTLLENAYNTTEWLVNRPLPNDKDKKKILKRSKWLDPYPAQLALLVTMAFWTEEVEQVLEEMEGGSEGNKMKDYYKVCEDRITELIERIKNDKELIRNRDKRVKIITVITVDVHSRDVVKYLLDNKINDSQNFNWKKQLRFYYSGSQNDCDIKIADYVTQYSYEYIGNTGRLVITPLTDRCYITLTQALSLFLGGAPAGPAGTGKTETTKDLGRNLGLGVIVNNCSDQMKKDTTERIFTGLAQTGFWGCFDEFNRISIEVLSVVASQVKNILDALRAGKKQFKYMSQEFEIRLVKTCGMFITMNPGYAGRSELPDNLKASFRWCAMVVPNLDKICENMLLCEGFNKATSIASKFITLYTLSNDLLSKQKHYDWGLRGIKSLLRQAGGLKRIELNQGKPEEYIIKKALFDFNKAKIVPVDIPIFNRLLDDLFKEQDGKTIKEDDVNKEINEQIEQATEKIVKFTKDQTFTTKVRQLLEIMTVRHCIFILGNPGTGKTSVWMTLFHTLKDIQGMESANDKLSPKAISKDELFGYNDRNKVWHFGVLSSIMQKMCKNEPPYTEKMKNKWIIIDGDIDPDWIESLNTVMDDNKVLTLNNGDRFPLDEAMRLLFEISNLRNATLATVTRGGVLYITDQDIGTQPFFDKWLYTHYGRREHELIRVTIQKVKSDSFERLRNDIRESKDKDKFIATVTEISLLQNVCTIFKNLVGADKADNWMTESSLDDDQKKKIIEGIYYFSFIWGVGGAFTNRKEMHSMVNSLMDKKLRLPDKGDCFDYYFDIKTANWADWENLKPKEYEFSKTELYSEIIIPNTEVIRLNRIIEINLLEDRAVLFVGDAGTGKTSIVNNFLKKIPTFKKIVGTSELTFKCYTINFNSFTDSLALQTIIESNISAKYSNRYGPINGKMVFFLDDLNMPELDKYNTQSHIELLRQVIDYKECYDRKELENKKILEDLLFVGCQNPKAGSFVIDTRLQRHFTLIATTEPKQEIIDEIYTTILNNHFKEFRFKGGENYQDLSKYIIAASFDLLEKFRKKEKTFFPTALKFHYQWNLREISRVVNGLLRTNTTFHKDSDTICRLWLHECNRIFRDRLLVSDLPLYETASLASFEKLECYKGSKEDIKPDLLIYIPFDESIEEENVLIQSKSMDHLKEYIANQLEEYNNRGFNIMPLVLFDDAIMHVCRIARIICNPSSHALLVGVGGSGKQSLARLACFIKSTEIAKLKFTGSDYNSEKLIEDMKECMKLSCLTLMEKQYAILLNDNHIISEEFMIYINNFLSSGWVDKFYETDADKELDVSKLKTQSISAEFMLRTEHDINKMFKYLIFRIKNSIHMILCMSPVGEKLKIRVRKFPGILSCTNIDWFHEWPVEALQKVSRKKIEEIEELKDDPLLIDKLAILTSEFHTNVGKFNELFRIQERRFNYITPKSFLELISFFKTLVQDKSGQLTYQLGRLTSGLKILSSTAEKISLMKVEIEEQTIKVNFQKEISNRDLADVEREQDKINSEKVKVEDATVIAQKDYAEATEAQASAEEELKEAMPIKISAKANAENIQVPQLNEFIRNPKPNAKYLDIFRLIYYIFYPEHKGKEPDMNVMKQGYLNWDAVTIKTKLLEKLDGNVEWLTNDFRVKTKKYQEDPVYKDEKAMRGIYSPVWDVVAFFHNLIKYKDAILKVDPLIQASAEAKEKAEKSTNNKNELEAKLELLIEEKNKVEQKYLKSKDEKERVEAEQKKLTDKYDMAMKFTSLLSGNEKRWKEDVIKLNEMKSKLGGDCILASAFVSYVGVFNNVFRENIVNKFKELIALKDIAITSGLDIVNLLVKEEEILKYKSENLPDDPFSIANAAIIKRCQRWPLIIDPQTQAMKWIRGMSGKKVIVQYGQKFWGKHIGEGIEAGDITVIEDCAQEIDALLLPLLGKETYRREGSLYIKLGSDEYVYNPNTTVYLVTKITNPHYQPEIAAQCTLINFIVTEKGLEDQLLALVVNTEQPELEDKIKKAFADINNFQRELIQKEDDVLRNLNSADENTILDNIELVTSLEQTKKSAQEIEEKSIITQTTINEIKINREIYRKVGEEGAMLFFLISKLFIIQLMYQFSLESFHHFFLKAISETQKFENVHERVRALRENIRISIFLWITAGMFERDKQLFLTMIALRLLQKKALVGEELQNITQKHIDFLLRNPKKNDCPPKDHALDWMDDNMWKSLNYLSDLPYFEEFASRMEKEQAQKFKDWYNEHQPEEVPLPLNWRVYKASSYQKLLVLACMRPDRISVAINHFVKEALPQGYRFLEARSFTDTLYQAFLDSSPEIPIFFILSPGSNPITEIIKLKKKLEHGKKNIKFEELAMGEGQDVFANQFLDLFNAEGGWLFLQNVHLMPNWLPKLQDKLKDLAREKGNDDFRLFLSAEPVKEIPVGIREKCLKLTNEPPSGLKENMKIAFNVLKNENPNIEDDRKRANIAFGLCYYHAVMIERKKFSSLGWNRNYPFTLDDLRNSDMVVGKYLENNTGKIPWDDLRYIVGEIMYGGHIVDDWDRILNMAYLEYLFDDKIHDELDLVPYPTNFAGTKYSLRTPANNVNFPFNKWGEYIEQYIKTESPAMFGLHPNAELDFRTQQASTLFQNLIDLEPKDGGGSGEETEQTKAEKIILECEEIMVIAGDGLFRMDEFDNLNEERTPFNNVFIQELEQMKMLCEVVKKNSFDLREALEGRLTMTDNLERIRMNIYTLRIPSDWLNNGFATNRKLPSWKKSLKLRIDQYNFFFNEKIPPKITFINRLFNPLSYLTAIKQDYAQRKKAELDKLTLFTEPTNHILFGNKVTSINDKNLGENATLVYGLHLQGARLEDESKMMEDSRPKEDYYVLPVINCVIRESTTAKMEDNKNYYVCPVYKTTNRDTTFVCKAYFKTKNYPAKWTIAGVAVILDVEKGDETNNFLAK